MLSSIATIICAAAMALSLSVEAGSFFRPSESPASTEGSGDDASSEPSVSLAAPTPDDPVTLAQRSG